MGEIYSLLLTADRLSRSERCNNRQLLSGLYHSAYTTEAHHERIIEEAPLNAFVLSDLPSGGDEKVEIETRHKDGCSTLDTVFTLCLFYLAEYVAWHEGSEDTQSNVAEAAKEFVRPFAHLDDDLFPRGDGYGSGNQNFRH